MLFFFNLKSDRYKTESKSKFKFCIICYIFVFEHLLDKLNYSLMLDKWKLVFTV